MNAAKDTNEAIKNLRSINGDIIDARTDELIKQFEDFANSCTEQDEALEDRDTICCGWLIQKVASLQLIVEAQQGIINGLIKNINELTILVYRNK